MYEYYQKLKSYSMCIYALYRKLAKLEIEYRQDSEEYSKTIELINQIKKLENNVYEEINKKNDQKLLLSISVIASQEMLGQKFGKRSIFEPAYLFSDKLKSSDVIPMRISYKVIDLFRHQYIKDDASFHIYDTYIPMRDKHFLDVLSDQIDNEEYREYRKMLIRAKYDYAFVNSKDVKELREYDESLEENENLDLIASLGTIIEYKDKFASLNLKTLMSPSNRRRLILDINYIRANALSVPDIQLMSLKEMIIRENTNMSEGMKVFLNIIDLTLEDKLSFDDGDIPYKRRF